MTDERIISGGGWQQEPETTPVLLGAVACLLAVCICGLVAVLTAGAIRWVTSVAGVLFFTLAIILSFIEKEANVPAPPDSEYDPRNLYASHALERELADSQQESRAHPLDAESTD